ncbi:MAG: disulfide isomerase DsbC N-terminal domain-containing protein, partial [Rhodocyclaceae bacterium]|nr:disulfide isomerase DsbC N-terminal domain-containing protein [Rhodocyclaceae bacterium]
MIKRALIGGLAALFAFAAHAEGGAEADVKKTIEASFGKGTKVDSVREAGFLGLYEVMVGGDLLYTDRKAGYLILGEVIDTKT